MKKMLLLIVGLTISLTGLSAENLSKAFSKELAQTKAAGNNVTMISSMEYTGRPHPRALGRSVALNRLLNTKEFKDFSTDKKVTVINYFRVVTLQEQRGKLMELAVKDARKILGNNAPITESHWRDIMSNSFGWRTLSEAEKSAFIKKKMSDPLPTHYVRQALVRIVNKERVNKAVAWKEFKTQTPTTILLDSEGNVLNRTVFNHNMKAKDYIEKYTEILEPEEEDEKEKDSKVKSKDAK